MQAFASVLFQMQAFDPHREGRTVLAFNNDFTLPNDRVLELADLVALRQVGIEIVLAIKQAT